MYILAEDGTVLIKNNIKKLKKKTQTRRETFSVCVRGQLVGARSLLAQDSRD